MITTKILYIYIFDIYIYIYIFDVYIYISLITIITIIIRKLGVEKLEDIYKNNVEKNRFETPKRYSFKNSDKTQDIETVTTRNRYEVLSDSDESDTKGCNNDNDKLSNNVTTSISSRQVNLGNNEIKKHQYEHKSKTKKKKK